MKNTKIIWPILILVSVCFMSVGYAAISSISLDITGTAAATTQSGLFITDVTYKSNVGADTVNSMINNFIGSIMNSTVVLGTSNNSSITYEVEVYNSTDNDYAFKSTTYEENFYDNNGIKFELSGMSKNTVIPSKQSKKFNITFFYENGANVSNTLNSYLNFSFGKNRTITYTNIEGTYQSNIAEGLTYTNTFSPAPDDIEVSMGGNALTKGTDFTYTNGALTISNVTGNLVITGVNSGSGGNGGTWENPVVDDTTTEYDPDNVPEGTTIYTNIAGEPKVTADENGNVTQFEYTDTGTNGIPVPSGGLDTGVLAFDGSDFEVTLKAKFYFNNAKGYTCPIINVSKKDPTVNGVLIYEYGNQKSGYGHDAAGNAVKTPYSKFRFGKYENSSSSGNVDFNISSKVTTSSMNGRYGYNASSSPVTLTFKLYCTNGVFTAEIYDANGTLLAKPYNNTSYSFTNVGSSFDDVTVVIGQYDGFGDGVSYTHDFDILEFNVEKK